MLSLILHNDSLQWTGLKNRGGSWWWRRWRWCWWWNCVDWTEKTKTKKQPKICLRASETKNRGLFQIIWKSLHRSVGKLNNLCLLRTSRSCTKMEKKKSDGRFLFFYSKRQHRCLSVPRGFPWGSYWSRKTWWRRDRLPPCQSVKKCSVSYSAPSIGNESDIYSKTHVCASSLFV